MNYSRQPLMHLILLLGCIPLTLFAKTPAELISDDWIETRSKNFHVISNDETKNVQAFIEDLEKFRHFASVLTGAHPKEDIPPLRVYAFATTTSFRALGAREELAGFFTGSLFQRFAAANIDGYKKGDDDNWARTVLFHEYVHFLMFSSQMRRDDPPWYVEGIAEYLSTMREEAGYIVFGATPTLRRRYVQGRYGNRKIEVEALFKLKERLHESDEAYLQYAQAWAIVHYLMSAPERRQQLKTYLNLVHQDESVDEAFSVAFNTDYKELGRRISRYLKQVKKPGLRTKNTRSFNQQTDTRTLSKGEVTQYLEELISSASKLIDSKYSAPQF